MDIEQYVKPSPADVPAIRAKLQLPATGFIYIYAGQFIERKNQKFLLDVFSKTFLTPDVYLLLLGDGPLYPDLQARFGNRPNIVFRGNVSNVAEYLQAADGYVSTSKSEGMPNGVLEAMACGLPVVLSDIAQHNEVIHINPAVGFAYVQGNEADLAAKMTQLVRADYSAMGQAAYDCAHKNFSAREMSRQYQLRYGQMAQKAHYHNYENN